MLSPRVAATLRWELVTQFRQGFTYAAIFVIIVWSIVLSQLPAEGVMWLVPAVLFMDVSVFGFYFMAGMLYLEMGDGVLNALVVTPLRKLEYLVVKVVALTFLSIIVSIGVAAIVVAITAVGEAETVGVNWLLLLAGVIFNSWLLILIGFIVAVRYDNISDFFLASLLFMIPFQLPMLDYFGIWKSWFTYLIPTQPTMLLMEAAFWPVPFWEITYSFLYLVVAIPIVTWLALRAYDRFVVQGGK